MQRGALLLALVIGGCHAADRTPAPSLEAHLGALAGADEAARRTAVEHWKLAPDEWSRVTTDPYRAFYADYAQAFDAAAPVLVTQLGHAGAIHARAHFAGDPKLTRAQARARWAQPIQAPSEIAELDGAPIDAVFVRVDGAWRAIVGIDAIIRSHAQPLDAACAALLDTVTPGPCGDAEWVVAEGALRGDGARFHRACALAANVCQR